MGDVGGIHPHHPATHKWKSPHDSQCTPKGTAGAGLTASPCTLFQEAGNMDDAGKMDDGGKLDEFEPAALHASRANINR